MKTYQDHQGRERRATSLALKTWVSARNDQSIPGLHDLAKSAVRAGNQETFTENQFLIFTDPAAENSVVIYYGNDLPRTLERQKIGKNIQNFLPTSLKGIFLEACMEAAQSDSHVYRGGEITTASRNRVLYRSVFMPLRSESQNESIYIFGAFSSETGGAELLAA